MAFAPAALAVTMGEAEAPAHHFQDKSECANDPD
jgi:hypothetical protein